MSHDHPGHRTESFARSGTRSAHTHDGPLESTTHVHGGAMVLDIGGSVGALHVVLDDGWLGRELFVATDDPAFTCHTGVWLRHVGGEHVATAMFAELEAGTYRILGADGAAATTVEVRGGEVADADLSAAARVAPGR
jgi:hypothetical protein